MAIGYEIYGRLLKAAPGSFQGVILVPSSFLMRFSNASSFINISTEDCVAFKIGNKINCVSVLIFLLKYSVLLLSQ